MLFLFKRCHGCHSLLTRNSRLRLNLARNPGENVSLKKNTIMKKPYHEGDALA